MITTVILASVVHLLTKRRREQPAQAVHIAPIGFNSTSVSQFSALSNFATHTFVLPAKTFFNDKDLTFDSVEALYQGLKFECTQEFARGGGLSGVKGIRMLEINNNKKKKKIYAEDFVGKISFELSKMLAGQCRQPPCRTTYYKLLRDALSALRNPKNDRVVAAEKVRALASIVADGRGDKYPPPHLLDPLVQEREKSRAEISGCVFRSSEPHDFDKGIILLSVQAWMLAHNVDAQNLLLRTGQAELVEFTRFGAKNFWARDTAGSGKNANGQNLMMLREVLMKEGGVTKMKSVAKLLSTWVCRIIEGEEATEHMKMKSYAKVLESVRVRLIKDEKCKYMA